MRALQDNPSFSAIHVFSRNPTTNILPGVQYHAGDLTSKSDVESVFSIVQPTVVFHVASAISVEDGVSSKLFHDVNVEGTKILLENAVKSTSTKIFIYTSPSSVSKELFHFNNELQPLAPTDSKTDFNYYTTTKVIAD